MEHIYLVGLLIDRLGVQMQLGQRFGHVVVVYGTIMELKPLPLTTW